MRNRDRMSLISPGRRSLVMAASLGVGFVVALGGCLGWTEYRAGDQTLGDYLVQQPTLDGLMADALGWTIQRFPPDVPAQAAEVGQFSVTPTTGEVAVALPSRVSRERYDAIALRASPSAFPLSPVSRHLPTYRIGTIKVRASGAMVDVHRPLPTPAGEPRRHQALTLHMRTSVGGWRVERYDTWSPGAVPLPPVVMMQDAPPRPMESSAQPNQSNPDGAASG